MGLSKNLVMYHRYIEIAGAKNSIAYDLTEIETNSKDGIVCIKCIAKRNGDTGYYLWRS